MAVQGESVLDIDINDVSPNMGQRTSWADPLPDLPLTTNTWMSTVKSNKGVREVDRSGQKHMLSVNKWAHESETP